MNIDNELWQARQHVNAWSTDAAREAARRISDRSAFTVDWDDGAGETWIRILDGERVVALVSIQLPLIIVEIDAVTESWDIDAELIRASSLDGTTLSAGRESIEAAFGMSARLESLDLEQFSANDLWYATV